MTALSTPSRTAVLLDEVYGFKESMAKSKHSALIPEIVCRPARMFCVVNTQ